MLASVAFVLALAIGRASADSIWQTPSNLSRSGSASLPVVAVSGDGAIHAMWWDKFEGTLYARSEQGTSAAPVAVPQIAGDRQVNQLTGKTVLAAPGSLRLLAAASGVSALWLTADSELMAARLTGAQWSQPVTLSTSAVAFNATTDPTGGEHLVYMQTASPAGIYYRGSGESSPVAVSSSPYFRVVKPENASLTVAAQPGSAILVVWDDQLLDQSVVSRSTDGGKTWSAPQAISGRQPGRVQNARVAAAPGGDFLLIWPDATSGGCGLTQKRSSDSGQTWDAPERVLANLARCPARWQFSSAGDGRLWLLGLPADDPQNPAQTASLAAWNGKTWSDAQDASVSFQNTATGRSLTLSCLNVALGGKTLGAIGCDDKGDVWATSSAIGLDQMLPALRPIWSAPQVLSDGSAAVEMPVVAADSDGRLYVMWSQNGSANDGSPALYTAVWDGTRWSKASEIFATTSALAGSLQGDQLKANQPALAIDSKGRLHAVWSGGTSGQIMYSWAGARDAASASAWSDAEQLRTPSEIAAWPDLVADPRADILHLLYAIPYNEKRGIYYSHSVARGEIVASSWTTPALVFDAVAARMDSVSKPRLALDAQNNVLHAVWLQSTLLSPQSPQAVYYTRSIDGGQTWDKAQKIAEGVLDWPSVIVAGNQVHVLWHRTRSGSSVELWDQFSTDRGVRWSQPAVVRGFDRVSGVAAAAADGAGAIYLAAVSQNANGESTIQTSRWDGSTWGQSESAGLGQNAAGGQDTALALVTKTSQLAVVLRRSILAADGAPQIAIAATGRAVQAAPVKPVATFTPVPTVTPTAAPKASPTPTGVTDFPMPDVVPPPSSDPLGSRAPLILGGAFSLVVLLGAVITVALRSSRR